MILWDTQTADSASDSSTDSTSDVNNFFTATAGGDTATGSAEIGLVFGGDDLVPTAPSKLFEELTTNSDGHTSLLFNEPQGASITFGAAFNGSPILNYSGNSGLIDISNLVYASSLGATSTNGDGGQITVFDRGSTVDTAGLQFLQTIGGLAGQSDGLGGALINPPSLLVASPTAAAPTMPNFANSDALVYAPGGGSIDNGPPAPLVPALLDGRFAAAPDQPVNPLTADPRSIAGDSLPLTNTPAPPSGLHLAG